MQCPPCKVFTPSLVSVYQTLTATGQNFEVVYVGADRSLEYFTEYFSSMPWLAIPYGDVRHDKLTKHFAVKGISRTYVAVTVCSCSSSCYMSQSWIHVAVFS